MVALEALKRLRLDRVWWLVSPGNPLKDTRELPGLAIRLEAARALARHPRLVVTGLEAEIGTRYTLETIGFLKARAPGVRFVWIMGADNLAGFHRWQGWRRIAASVPIAVFDRPGHGLTPLSSKFAVAFAARRLPPRSAATLASRRPPAWIFLRGRLSLLSSTKLRRAVLKTQR